MMKNKFYFHSEYIEKLKKEFHDFMIYKSVDINRDTRGHQIRELMFDFFKTEKFLDSYFKIASDGANSVNLSTNGLVLQNIPTPRVFRPGDHGTSFHTDYWYGHGKSAYTIWVPLTQIDEENTFRICHEKSNNKFLSKFEKNPSVIEAEKELVANSFAAMPDKHQAVIFGSQMLHGSPINSSLKERISIDFRISNKNDETSTKDVLGYYEYFNDSFRKQSNRFAKTRFLKYIYGGNGKNTNAQHLLIETTAKFYSINVVAQEAEIERYGFPMLQSYLDNLALTKNIEGIVIASRSIIDIEQLKISGETGLILYFCLENEFIIL